MEQGEHNDERHLGRKRSDTWRTRSDRELIVAMRADVFAAFDEFVARYEPLLRSRSRRMQLPEWERDECVADALESVILHLLKPGVRAPATMAAYLTRALYNRLADVTRARQARRSGENGAVDWSGEAREHAVTAAVSQYTVHACQPTDASSPQLAPGLERLAVILIRPLSDEERLLLSWEGSMIPHRTVAEWLGISRGAATKRIWRLRGRLRQVAVEHVSSLAPAERVEVERFLNRRLDGPDHCRIGMVAEATNSPYRTGNQVPGSPAEEQPDE